MNSFLTKILPIVLVLFVLSCKESETKKSNNWNQGLISLNSKSELEVLSSELNQSGDIQSVQVPSGFVSYGDRYNDFLQNLDKASNEEEFSKILESNSNIYKIVGSGENREIVPLVDDGLIMSVFNKDGLLKIGNEIYKISNIGLESVSVTNQLTKEKLVYSMQNLQGYKKQALRESTVAIGNSSTARRVETCESDYKRKRKNYRLKGEIFSNKVGDLFSNIGARTKHQKKTLGIWFNNSTSWVSLDVNGQITQTLNGTGLVTMPVSYSGSKSNDGKISKVFQFCVATDCEFDVDYMNNTHKARCTDGNVRTCYTNY